METRALYVLATREQLGVVGTTSSRACDCVEVYLQSSGQRVFKMTFHHSMSFKQIVLVGQETQRALLLLTGVASSSGLQIVFCRFLRTAEMEPPWPMTEVKRRKCRNGLSGRWQARSGHKLIGRCCDQKL